MKQLAIKSDGETHLDGRVTPEDHVGSGLPSKIVWLFVALPAGTERALYLEEAGTGSRLVLLLDGPNGLPTYQSAHTRASAEYLEVTNLAVPPGWSVVFKTAGDVPPPSAKMTIMVEPYPAR